MVCLLSLAIFFRDFLDSGFNLIAGDLGDNRMLIVILEHWRAVAHGQAFFTSPNFYWPQLGVLGYSESFFLDALPYAAWRAAGLDVYVAFELTLIFFKAVGFFSMLWLLRSCIGVSRSTALIGSALFTLSNLYFINVNHSQLLTVVVVPLVVALTCTAWRAYGREQTLQAHIYSALLGLSLALILYTSFYIGWFVMLVSAIVIISALVYEVFRHRTLLPLCISLRAAARRGPVLGTTVLVFEIAMIPFIMTYEPVLTQTGGRSFSDALVYSAQPVDVINVGRSNWIWGHLLDSLRIRFGYGPMVPSEAETGWPPLTLTLLGIGFVLGFSRTGTRRGAALGRDRAYFLMPVLSAACIIGWAFSVKLHDHSLWWAVFKLVPGGSGIRVPARFNLVLNILTVVVGCLVLDELCKRGGRIRRSIFWGLSLLLLLEQTNTAATHLIARDAENTIFRRVHRPPSACDSFFLTAPATSERPAFANQIDAMLVARMYNIPTLNGYSGWSPPGWNLSTFDKTYLQDVRDWARSKGIVTGLCGLDLRNGSWISGIPE